MAAGARRAASYGTGIGMLDGYVTAIVAGSVSITPLDWICSPSMPMHSTMAARRSSRRSAPSHVTTSA